MPSVRDTLLFKSARAAAGLAPEDACVEQARYTAYLRGDPGYVARWLRFEARGAAAQAELDTAPE